MQDGIVGMMVDWKRGYAIDYKANAKRLCREHDVVDANEHQWETGSYG
jgi:hypothetical protein